LKLELFFPSSSINIVHSILLFFGSSSLVLSWTLPTGIDFLLVFRFSVWVHKAHFNEEAKTT